MGITEQIAELRAKLEELERQTQEEPKPLLTGPCIAKTRSGMVVPVFRNASRTFPFAYRLGTSCASVTEDGDYVSPSTCVQEDISEVIRPLTEQEVLDWHFRGIEPDVSEVSNPVTEGFEHSDEGRKEAEQMGLVHLGKATSEGMHEVNGTLYYFDYWNDEWKPNPGDYWVCKAHIYAYKPSGE